MRPAIPFSVLVFCWVCLTGLVVQAGDWPQILGPNRNGIAIEENLPDEFKAGGPIQVWEHPVGQGFSGSAISNGLAVLFHRTGQEEVVEGVNLANGEPIWKVPFPTTYDGQIIPDEGPRAVPLISDNQVFVYGASGGLRCLDRESGRLLWKKNLLNIFGAREGYFGAACSPILVDNLLILNVGGFRENAGIVALDRDTGKTVWTNASEHASYSSPVLANINGKQHLFVTTRLTTFSLDPKTGSENFSIPFGKRGPTVNAANPIIMGDKLFLTASYGIGEIFGTIKDNELEILWKTEHLLDSQYTTSIVYNKHLFGVDGRQDGGTPSLRCLNPDEPGITWEKRGLGYATLIGAGDKLLHFNTEGELRLLKANTEKYQELDHAQLFTGTTRALPALSNGLFLARDEKHFRCFQLSE